VGGFFSLCVVIGAPFAVEVVGGAKFGPSVAVLQILGVGIVATFLVATWSFALLTLRLYRELIAVNAFMIVLAAVLSLLLIPSHQARGAAVVTATLEVTLALLYGAVLTRRRPELRPSLAQLPRVAVAFGAAFAVAALLPVYSVAALAAGVVVLVACLAALHAVPDEFLHALRRRGGG
jgi:O-antigen/teichoic acid export membrane protein